MYSLLVFTCWFLVVSRLETGSQGLLIQTCISLAYGITENPKSVWFRFNKWNTLFVCHTWPRTNVRNLKSRNTESDDLRGLITSSSSRVHEIMVTGNDVVVEKDLFLQGWICKLEQKRDLYWWLMITVCLNWDARTNNLRFLYEYDTFPAGVDSVLQHSLPLNVYFVWCGWFLWGLLW